MPREVLLFRREDVRVALELPPLIDAVERAFVAYSTGEAELPEVLHLDIPERRGEVHVKTGHLHGAPHYAVKVASGFYGLDPPALDGLVVAFDAADGAPAALVLDDGLLTDLRTAAAGGVAARLLAPDEVEVVAVLGTGVQARRQLEALACVRSFRRVRVWGRHPDRAQGCVDDGRRYPGRPEGCRFEIAPSVEAAVDGAQVVITCTASRQPLLQAAWLASGAHVTAVGSDGIGKQELAPRVLAEADLVVVDSRLQCARLGELQHALAAGLIASPHDVAELGEVAAGRRPGRTSPHQNTVCDLTGVGVQDVAATALLLARRPPGLERILL